ncbi:uncharacterized protein LOC106961626 isoform X2 [Poecilia latipinna]|nr:PREDICTED: uncharacterized protein LOC106961626 isoform X2 [Poecilia latipinna]XP_016529499.1 PREDICTED: uncharacterized protein LOC107836811 isoform X2 [Poecilia formosa]
MYTPRTMKTIIFLMCMGCSLPVQSHATDRYSYCESCLTAAREIEKGIKEAPAGSRHTAIDKLLSWRLCEKLLTSNHEHVSKDAMKSACIHLLDSHRTQFRAALVKKETKNLDIVLCYELSHACIGVKRQTFQDSKATLTDDEIAGMLRDNPENVRISQPIYEASPEQRRNEL